MRSAFPLRLLIDQVNAPTHHRDSEWRVHAIKLQMSLRQDFDQRLYLFRSCVLHTRQNIGINVEHERQAGMSQLPLITFRETPAINEMVAATWAQPYSRMAGNPADLSNGLNLIRHQTRLADRSPASAAE
jgi:hypothetical protein